ncbi:hypothetical protein GGR22_003157 [Flavobacterium gossypii]|uniref:Uncharacterized protein n=1 Tax=Flavobacterium gossypii TaxID=1646119 RepID=A0ABR6DTE1_9FLAO|nr:hypothetical protein [Flavobacterium gossypii]
MLIKSIVIKGLGQLFFNLNHTKNPQLHWGIVLFSIKKIYILWKRQVL